MDRGSFSVEVILTLFAFKALYPQHVHLSRGNHESKGMNKIYGFEGEVCGLPYPSLACISHKHTSQLSGHRSRQERHAQRVLPAQVKAKYNATMADLFREVFCWLPLAHVLNQRVLVVHGGLFSSDSVTLDDIRSIDRHRSASCGINRWQHWS